MTNEKVINIIDFASRKEKQKNTLRKAGSVSFFLGLFAICFIMFNMFPLIYGIIMAFSEFSQKSIYPQGFVGFDNFTKIFSNAVLKKDFWGAIGRTLAFAAIVVPLSIIIPLGLALLINTKVKGYKFFRACIYLPTIFPLTATGLILIRMFGYQYGFINNFFNIQVDWLTDKMHTWFMILLLCLWTGIGGNFLILCAGLENVDKTLYEASNVDGCNKFSKFIHVTLPGISSQLFLCIFSTLTGYMNLYGQIYILANNNPHLGEMKTAIYVIQDMLRGSSRSLGYASAMAILLGLIIMSIALVQFIVSKERKGGNAHEKAFIDWKKMR